MAGPLSLALLVLLIITIGVLLIPGLMRWLWKEAGVLGEARSRACLPRIASAQHRLGRSSDCVLAELLARHHRAMPRWQRGWPAPWSALASSAFFSALKAAHGRGIDLVGLQRTIYFVVYIDESEQFSTRLRSSSRAPGVRQVHRSASGHVVVG
jgi:hypothetical protein